MQTKSDHHETLLRNNSFEVSIVHIDKQNFVLLSRLVGNFHTPVNPSQASEQSFLDGLKTTSFFLYMSLVQHRLRKELHSVSINPPPGCAAWAKDDTLSVILGTIDVCYLFRLFLCCSTLCPGAIELTLFWRQMAY